MTRRLARLKAKTSIKVWRFLGWSHGKSPSGPIRSCLTQGGSCSSSSKDKMGTGFLYHLAPLFLFGLAMGNSRDLKMQISSPSSDSALIPKANFTPRSSSNKNRSNADSISESQVSKKPQSVRAAFHSCLLCFLGLEYNFMAGWAWALYKIYDSLC